MDSTVRSNTTSASVELPRQGDVIAGKYRIESVVGTGGMGVVLGAADLSLNRPVAIKFLSPHKVQCEAAVARFLREARAAAAIQSEHVVRVYEIGTLESGAPFIVMEHLRGADLSQVLAQRGPMPIEDACDLVLQTCEALGQAHAHGIVHRDLKPQNLFVTQLADGSPCVKVLDFGISKAADDGGASNLTSTDMVMGTPLYMSPEQVRSLKNVDARADIWALGSILFELLTQSPIFYAPSASALCAMIAMDPPTPLRARRPQAPAELEAVILRCLHKDPKGRFSDVAQLAAALAPFASDRGRLSATRVSAVVRSGTGPAPFGGASVPQLAGSYPPGGAAYGTTSGTGPTMGVPGMAASPMGGFAGPPFVSPGPGYPGPTGTTGGHMVPASLPPHPTQSNWNHSTGGAPSPARSGPSGALVAVLGVLTGLVFLGLGAGGYMVVVGRDVRPPAPTPADAAPPAVTIAPTPPTASAPPSASVAPPVKKDPGPPRVPGPDPKKAEDERNAVLGRAAEQQCRFHQSQMTTFAQDDAARKRAATSAKGFMCRGGASSRCERQVCKEACLVLGDQMCIQQITFTIEHGQPPKY